MVFAIEHGLSSAEIDTLKRDVRAAASDAEACERYWLPWVIYATEFGYGYSGREYWQTFRSETPSWYAGSDDRWLRHVFEKFIRRYSGVRPSGRWAEHYSIISWPITHAILPKDLQIDLARALYDARRSLSGEVMADAALLGALVEHRAVRCSKRFRTFASQHDLVGTIAAALVGQESGNDRLIFPATLQRIATDLQKTRDAREWLRDARRNARAISLSGGRLRRRSEGASSKSQPEVTREDVIVETGDDLSPRLSVRYQGSNANCEVWLEVPDMRALAHASPESSEILNTSRVFVAGFEGTPRPRGSLMDGFSVELTRWPRREEPLVWLERSTPELDFLLSGEAMLPKGELLVFKLRGNDEGILLSSPTIRQGRRYVVLSGTRLSCSLLKQASTSCVGLEAYYLVVPTELSRSEVQSLRSVGLRDTLDVTVLPVGKVAAGWATADDSVWLSTEHPRFAITCGFPAEVRITAGAHHLERQVNGKTPLFVELPLLPVGEHMVDITVSSEALSRVEQFPMRIISREPRPHISELASPLRLRLDPPSPSLEELWEGTASLSLNGPEGAPLTIEFGILCNGASQSRLYESRLPLDVEAWAEIIGRIRRDEALAAAYDLAKSSVIAFDAGLVGARQLEAFPSLAPLKWIARRNSGSYALQLLDQTGTGQVQVMHYAFDRPDIASEEKIEGERLVGDVPHGLHVAFSVDVEAGFITAPQKLTSFSELNVRPRLARNPVDPAQRANRLLCLLGRWASAGVPGAALAHLWRRQVLVVLEDDLFRVLGGINWTKRAPAEPWKFTLAKLQELSVGITGTETTLSRTLFSRYDKLLALPLAGRVREFSHLTGCRGKPTSISDRFNEPEVDDLWLPEFILRLASEPHKALHWAGRMSGWGVARCLEDARSVRAARFLVHALDCMELTPETAQLSLHAAWGWK